MLTYKDKEFYNEYFSQLDDFNLTKKFDSYTEKDKKNILIGTIEANNTIHPLTIIVEIPVTFPHNKLQFSTSSIYGYPHLIPFKKRDGSWFCLNSPFAETAEQQLNIEMERLREWIRRQMREDLPAVIEDPELRKSLLRMNAYGWEVIDEMNEFRKDAMLTFVGDFANHPESLKERVGKFNCVKNDSNRFFVLDSKIGTNCQLPYIIVDEVPRNFDDFMSCAEQYDWDEKTCRHLLFSFWVGKVSSYANDKMPKYAIKNGKTEVDHGIWEGKDHMDEEEALVLLEEAVSNLVYPDSLKEIIEKEILSIKKTIKDDKGIRNPDIDYRAPSKQPDFDPTNPEDEAEEQDFWDEYWIGQDQAERGYYKLEHFALGIIEDGSIYWFLCSTNQASKVRETQTYDLGIKDLKIERLVSLPMDHEFASYITKSSYFGRGALTESLLSKSIAIIGAGALGSMVAESLARSGAGRFGIWDNDIVEPGNICRSVYSRRDLGENKARALANHLRLISPYCEVKTTGSWYEERINGRKTYHDGEFYSSVNYNSQEEALKQLDGYDVIIDCTGSNELLHFLSYAIKEKLLLSMCITNHSNDLLCFSNQDGNPFELRKLYLSKIEQDTKNFFVEGSGCYSPTFLALNCDVASLVNLAVRDINLSMQQGTMPCSAVWSHSDRGVVVDRLRNYRLENGDIKLSISSETYMDAQEMEYAGESNYLGFILGGYSMDRKHIMISHVISTENSRACLENAYRISNGIIDYIGDFTFSDSVTGTFNDETLEIIAGKAASQTVNANNPLLAVRNTDGSVSFYLYLNGTLVPFHEE